MKRLLALYTIVFAVNLTFVLSVLKIVSASSATPEEVLAYYSFSGIHKLEVQNPDLASASIPYAGGEDTVINTPERNVVFMPFTAITAKTDDLLSKEMPKGDERVALYDGSEVTSTVVDADMTYHNTFKELPLMSSDYYYKKYVNASAGVVQLNRMPILTAGKSISIIRDRYLVITSQNGYVTPPAYVYGSGVCWTTSVLGAMLDDANAAFYKKYGIDLVVYNPGDRAPHGGFYLTYTNNHHGYTVLQSGIGVAVQDYTFKVNPAIKNIPEIADLKIKIVFLKTDKHPTGDHGESIAAYIISNKEF